MPPRDASELASRLAQRAEAVCRRYLSNGRRQGRYWLVGDARNAPGRSMFVRLKGSDSGKGAAGKWTDAATGEHGDLLDVIRESLGLVDRPQDRGDAVVGLDDQLHFDLAFFSDHSTDACPSGSSLRRAVVMRSRSTSSGTFAS